MGKEILENGHFEEMRKERLRERKILEERIDILVAQIVMIQKEGFFQRDLDIIFKVPKIQKELEDVEQKLKIVRATLEHMKTTLSDECEEY